MSDQLKSGLLCIRSNIKEFLSHHDLKDWFEKRSPVKFEPFYSSFDLRDAEFKIAPVDANLFPAGFNNICPEDLFHAADLVKSLLQKQLGKLPKKMAILPEAHTKNKFYVNNLLALKGIFERAGIRVEIGWWPENGELPDHSQPALQLESIEGTVLQAHPFYKKGNRLLFEPFEPEFIVVNNDFSSGYPKALDDIEQPVMPSPKLGWHTRKKSDFFHYYNHLVEEFSHSIGIDPWHLQVDTVHVGNVDFDTKEGLDRIAAAAATVLDRMKVEYAKRKIDEKPFVFMKSNAGTYGMGVMRIEDPKEILELNRRERNKMAVGKNGLPIHDVVVKEGIPTRFQIEGVYAEPAIYLFGRELMGGFLRKNPNRGKVDNLNSKGMVFQKLCISDLRMDANRDLELELVYGTISQICAAALALEAAKSLEPVVGNNQQQGVTL